jgi:hypothetical protein
MTEVWCTESLDTGRCCHRDHNGLCAEEAVNLIVFVGVGPVNAHLRCDDHTYGNRSCEYTVQELNCYWVMLSPNSYLLAMPSRKAAIRFASDEDMVRACKVLNEDLEIVRRYAGGGVRVNKKGEPV